MPFISYKIEELAPNTIDLSDPNSQSNWFSRVRRMSSNEYNGTIIPPTKTEFYKVWNSINDQFLFACRGDTTEECERSLETNNFPSYRISNRMSQEAIDKKIKVVTWTRMIMAFNMRAKVNYELMLNNCISPFYSDNMIDFIGSAGPDNNMIHSLTTIPSICNNYSLRRYALHIVDDTLNHMIQLVKDRRDTEFWRCIFFLYENHRCEDPYIHRQSISSNYYNTHIKVISQVDRPTHAIACEYLNRTGEDRLDITIGNKHIADMIMQVKTSLPYDLRKTICEICS